MAIADSNGLPLALSLAPGNRNEVCFVEQTLDAAFTRRLPGKLIGDKAYDSAPLIRQLAHSRRIELIAPVRRMSHSTPSRKPDGRALRRYKRRWKVERLFAWLKRNRRISTRHEFKADNFLGFVHLGCIKIMLKHF